MYDVDFDRLIENYKIFSIKMDRKTVRHAFPHKSVSYIHIYIIYICFYGQLDVWLSEVRRLLAEMEIKENPWEMFHAFYVRLIAICHKSDKVLDVS